MATVQCRTSSDRSRSAPQLIALAGNDRDQELGKKVDGALPLLIGAAFNCGRHDQDRFVRLASRCRSPSAKGRTLTPAPAIESGHF
jgi:hypothetical protein